MTKEIVCYYDRHNERFDNVPKCVTFCDGCADALTETVEKEIQQDKNAIRAPTAEPNKPG